MNLNYYFKQMHYLIIKYYYLHLRSSYQWKNPIKLNKNRINLDLNENSIVKKYFEKNHIIKYGFQKKNINYKLYNHIY